MRRIKRSNAPPIKYGLPQLKANLAQTAEAKVVTEGSRTKPSAAVAKGMAELIPRPSNDRKSK